MQTISLAQPWASFVAAGLKRVITQTYATGYRGRLAIYAGASRCHLHETPVLLGLADLTDGSIRELLRLGPHARELPLGTIVATAEVRECLPTHVLLQRGLGRQERALGDYGFGRWAWITRDVRQLDPPVPTPWPVPDHIIAQIGEEERDEEATTGKDATPES